MSIYTNTLQNNSAALTTTRFGTTIKNDRIYEIDKYLSEIQHILVQMLLSNSQTFLLNSPTGTGKNDTFLYRIDLLKKKKYVISLSFLFFLKHKLHRCTFSKSPFEGIRNDEKRIGKRKKTTLSKQI